MRWLVGAVLLVALLTACSDGADTAPPGTTTTTGGGGSGEGGGGGDGGGGQPPACSRPPISFWTWDLAVMPPADVQIAATCRAESEHAYLYVADDVWDAGHMTQAQVDTIVSAFEKATPADPSRGIYQTDVETFGEPPDVDGDPHVYLFYLSMGDYMGYSFDGFFRGIDETDDATSNKVEMLHLNATGTKAPDTDYMLGVVIHELVHLINDRYDQSDEGWLMESLAEAAMTLGGYMTDLPAGQDYVKTTAVTPLCVKSYSNYGATFAWGSYMLDRWGPSFLQSLLQDPADGPDSIDALLPMGTTFKQAFGELMVANLLDQPSIGDGRYGFASIDIAALGSETKGTVDGAPHDSDAVAWGGRMLRLEPASAGTLAIDLASADWDKLVVHTVVLDPKKPAGAKVTAQTIDSDQTAFSVAVQSGDVVDLVVAVAPKASVADSGSAPKSSFTYTATLTP